MVYPDGSDAKTLPGSLEDFTLEKYRDDLGKPYARVMLLLSRDGCYKGSDMDENISSDDDQIGEAPNPDDETSVSNKNLVRGPSTCTSTETQAPGNESASNENLPSTSTARNNNSGIYCTV